MTKTGTSNLAWDDIDDKAVTFLRGLAMDAVQKVGNGHPGTAMSLAPAAYLLFQKVMRHDPSDPQWLGRDRFVLSAGHSSLTLYSQLFLSGYGLTMADLQSFRTWGSLTPGHPEYGHTRGVETTTGPLGQGLSTAVGMAMSARYERGLFDPDAAQGVSPFDHRIWVIASDGDLEEGITSEASSLAGLQELSSLCVLWDDNHISIEGDTSVAFREDVVKRYAAYGWNTLFVDMRPDGSIDEDALFTALETARASTSAPTFIQLRTTIAWPAPKLRGTAKSHGSALGADEVAATKVEMGLDPTVDFAFDEAVLNQVRNRLTHRTELARRVWDESFADWKLREPERASLLDRLMKGQLPSGVIDALPTYQPGAAIATRKASGETINALAGLMPELWGGSADLAESNNTTIEGGLSFLPEFSPTSSPYGRIIHFGIREHAMGAIMNGIALDGLTRVFGGTFLVFSDYMRGAVRLAALMQAPVTYVWTHDSIGLGEDGPTHQPIEHLWSLRLIPGLSVVRPADANEAAAAWLATIDQRRPVGLILSRQNLTVLNTDINLVREGVRQGAYVVADSDDPQVLLLATGSEVALAVQAHAELQALGMQARVVSMPCLEWFDEQDAKYREGVIPSKVRARVAIEAGATLGWYKYIGTEGVVIGIDHFGASAAAETLFTEFGITVTAIVEAAQTSVARDRGVNAL
ncbi:MAG: transketolase [Candidatus Nanopelagicales bacterium]|nr:transketolase [Candidatus Nanopelagicales bacterium]